MTLSGTASESTNATRSATRKHTTRIASLIFIVDGNELLGGRATKRRGPGDAIFCGMQGESQSGFFLFFFLHFPPPPPHIVQCFSTASEQCKPLQIIALQFEHQIGECNGIGPVLSMRASISDTVMYSELAPDIEGRGNSKTDVHDSSHFPPESPHVEACFSRKQRTPLQSNALHFEHKIRGCDGISGCRLLWKIKFGRL